MNFLGKAEQMSYLAGAVFKLRTRARIPSLRPRCVSGMPVQLDYAA